MFDKSLEVNSEAIEDIIEMDDIVTSGDYDTDTVDVEEDVVDFDDEDDTDDDEDDTAVESYMCFENATEVCDGLALEGFSSFVAGMTDKVSKVTKNVGAAARVDAIERTMYKKIDKISDKAEYKEVSKSLTAEIKKLNGALEKMGDIATKYRAGKVSEEKYVKEMTKQTDMLGATLALLDIKPLKTATVEDITAYSMMLKRLAARLASKGVEIKQATESYENVDFADVPSFESLYEELSHDLALLSGEAAEEGFLQGECDDCDDDYEYDYDEYDDDDIDEAYAGYVKACASKCGAEAVKKPLTKKEFKLAITSDAAKKDDKIKTGIVKGKFTTTDLERMGVLREEAEESTVRNGYNIPNATDLSPDELREVIAKTKNKKSKAMLERILKTKVAKEGLEYTDDLDDVVDFDDVYIDDEIAEEANVTDNFTIAWNAIALSIKNAKVIAKDDPKAAASKCGDILRSLDSLADRVNSTSKDPSKLNKIARQREIVSKFMIKYTRDIKTEMAKPATASKTQLESEVEDLAEEGIRKYDNFAATWSEVTLAARNAKRLAKENPRDAAIKCQDILRTLETLEANVMKSGGDNNKLTKIKRQKAKLSEFMIRVTRTDMANMKKKPASESVVDEEVSMEDIAIEAAVKDRKHAWVVNYDVLRAQVNECKKTATKEVTRKDFADALKSVKTAEGACKEIDDAIGELTFEEYCEFTRGGKENYKNFKRYKEVLRGKNKTRLEELVRLRERIIKLETRFVERTAKKTLNMKKEVAKESLSELADFCNAYIEELNLDLDELSAAEESVSVDMSNMTELAAMESAMDAEFAEFVVTDELEAALKELED